MLTKNRILLILGIWITLIPFSGFPRPYNSFLITGSGLLVVILAFLLAREKRHIQKYFSEMVPSKKAVTEVYAESHPMWNKENIRSNFEQN